MVMLKIAFEVYTEITVGILLISYKMYTEFLDCTQALLVLPSLTKCFQICNLKLDTYLYELVLVNL